MSDPYPPRNKSCPCGSGKKYKKCCWSNVMKDLAEWRKPPLTPAPTEDDYNATVKVNNIPKRSGVMMSLMLASAVLGSSGFHGGPKIRYKV